MVNDTIGQGNKEGRENEQQESQSREVSMEKQISPATSAQQEGAQKRAKAVQVS